MSFGAFLGRCAACQRVCSSVCPDDALTLSACSVSSARVIPLFRFRIQCCDKVIGFDASSDFECRVLVLLFRRLRFFRCSIDLPPSRGIIHTMHWCVYLNPLLFSLLPPDLSFITTWPFLWKVSAITLVSCLPLYIIKYLKRKFSPPSYSKLSS